jgi:hypothetical protein
LQLEKIYESFNGEQLANYIYQLFSKVMVKELSIEEANEYAQRSINYAQKSWSNRKSTGFYKAEVVEESRKFCERNTELLLEDLESLYEKNWELKKIFVNCMISTIIHFAKEDKDKFFNNEENVLMLIRWIELKEEIEKVL